MDADVIKNLRRSQAYKDLRGGLARSVGVVSAPSSPDSPGPTPSACEPFPLDPVKNIFVNFFGRILLMRPIGLCHYLSSWC